MFLLIELVENLLTVHSNGAYCEVIVLCKRNPVDFQLVHANPLLRLRRHHHADCCCFHGIEGHIQHLGIFCRRRNCVLRNDRDGLPIGVIAHICPVAAIIDAGGIVVQGFHRAGVILHDILFRHTNGMVGLYLRVIAGNFIDKADGNLVNQGFYRCSSIAQNDADPGRLVIGIAFPIAPDLLRGRDVKGLFAVVDIRSGIALRCIERDCQRQGAAGLLQSNVVGCGTFCHTDGSGSLHGLTAAEIHRTGHLHDFASSLEGNTLQVPGHGEFIGGTIIKMHRKGCRQSGRFAGDGSGGSSLHGHSAKNGYGSGGLESLAFHGAAHGKGSGGGIFAWINPIPGDSKFSVGPDVHFGGDFLRQRRLHIHVGGNGHRLIADSSQRYFVNGERLGHAASVGQDAADNHGRLAGLDVVLVFHHVIKAIAERCFAQGYAVRFGTDFRAIVIIGSQIQRNLGSGEIRLILGLADAQLRAGHELVGLIPCTSAGFHAVEAHILGHGGLIKGSDLPVGVVRPVAFRDFSPFLSVSTDFHAVFRHNAIGNGRTRLIAQGIQQGSFCQRQLNIAFLRLLPQIFSPRGMPEGRAVVIHRKFDGAFISAFRLCAGCSGSGLGVVIVAAVVGGILDRFRIQVDGIAAAGGVIF